MIHLTRVFPGSPGSLDELRLINCGVLLGDHHARAVLVVLVDHDQHVHASVHGHLPEVVDPDHLELMTESLFTAELPPPTTVLALYRLNGGFVDLCAPGTLSCPWD